MSTCNLFIPTIIMHGVRGNCSKRYPQSGVREVESEDNEQHYPSPWVNSVFTLVIGMVHQPRVLATRSRESQRKTITENMKRKNEADESYPSKHMKFEGN